MNINAVAEAFHDNLLLQLVEENRQYKAQLNELTSVQILYLHKKDKTLSMGSFIHGKFDDEVVPKQTMYTINTRTVKKMELNDIGMIEVNVSNCEFISISIQAK